MIKENLKNKKVAIILAFRDFRDEEYFETKEVLEKAGIEIKTVSDSQGKAIGMFGGEAEVDILLSDLKAKDFDAILFIGGAGAISHLDNQFSYKIAKDSILENKILGAICISPTILAKAGVLKGKKATVWSSITDTSPIKILERNSAHYLSQSVVVDGKIVTANGPGAAKEFGQKIVELLTEK
jgi:protease I